MLATENDKDAIARHKWVQHHRGSRLTADQLTSLAAPAASSGSLNTTGCPPRSNLMFLRDAGVGDEANGYSFGSR